MAVSGSYCTSRDLKDVYPNIDEFDNKTPIYGWETDNTYYVAYNSGLTTQLFIDSKSQQSGKQSIGTTALTTINDSDVTASDTEITVTDGTTITDDTYIKIGDEIILVTNVATHVLTVTRGHFGTTASTHADVSSVYQHFSPVANGDWLSDSDNDFVILKYGSDPNNSLTEAGEDWATLKTRYIKNASRYLDARLDATLSRDAFKDKEGNYDYVIIRTSSLIACSFLIKSMDSSSQVSENFMNEAEFLINQLNDGKTKLSHQISGDSSQGNLREVVTPSNANPLRIVDVQGRYTGTGYDLIKIFIDTGDNGVIGTGKFTVAVKDSTGLKKNTVVDSEVITGDYQHIGNGLKIRYAGQDDDSVANANDEYELEVVGWSEPVDNATVRTVRMSRSMPTHSYYRNKL